MRIPWRVSHFCKMQPDVSIKAVSKMSSVNWLSGGQSHSATGVCIGWVSIGGSPRVSQSKQRQMQTEEAAQQTCKRRKGERRSPASQPTNQPTNPPSVQTQNLSINMERKTADFSGKWTMKSSENFEELLKALGE